MWKAIGTFVIGFVGTVLFLNAITWLFGEVVAAIIAWCVAVVALVVLIWCMTVGGYDAPKLSGDHEEALRDYLKTVAK